jgi:hypothetical protein
MSKSGVREYHPKNQCRCVTKHRFNGHFLEVFCPKCGVLKGTIARFLRTSSSAFARLGA